MAAVARPIKNVPFFLKKITPKFVTEAMNKSEPPERHINLLALQRPVEARHLYDLYGIIRVATIVPDKSGTKADSVRFSGKLKAFTPADENGEQYVFESGQVFIPVLDTYLYSALKSAQEVEAAAYLEVALSIGIKTAETGKPSMTGYEWEVQNLITQAPPANDPIERLRLEAKAQQLALAAPKKETSPTVPTAATKEGLSGSPTASKTDSGQSGLAATDGSRSGAGEPAPKHGKGRHAGT